MGYINNNLIRDEHIIYQTKFHWWVWGADIFLAVVGAAILFTLLPSFFPKSKPAAMDATSLFLVFMIPLLLLSFLITLLRDVITWSTSELGITNRRILAKKGWIRRRVAEINLSQFESCQLSESILGRLLGYKTVILTGSGGTREVYRVVANAKEYRNHIMEQVDLNNRSSAKYSPGISQQPQVIYQQQNYADPLFDLPPETPTSELREVSALIKAGKRTEAVQIVRGLLHTHAENADVWYLAGYLQTDPKKKRAAYEKALNYNPNHKLAKTGLSALR